MELTKILVCPLCKSKLNSKLICSRCKKKYNYINKKPIFIKPISRSNEKILGFFIKHARWLIPSPSFNFIGKSNLSFIKKQLKNKNPVILIVGGGAEHSKTKKMVSGLSKTVINLELVDGLDVDVIGDAHYLPFKENCFDLVVILAVLEHVKYPSKVVDEIYRVLKKGGIVYSEVPFIQGIHGRPYDFQRYTNVGLDVLFEKYKKIKSGSVLGPTGSIIWIFREYLALLFSFNMKYLYYFFNLVFGWLFFPFKYLDVVLIKLKFSSNIAGGFYYIGKK